MKEKRRFNLWSRRWSRGILLAGWLMLLTPCFGEPASGELYGQQVQFNFSLKNAGFDKLMQQIRLRSSYEFVYKDSEVEEVKGLTRIFSKAGIEEVLTTCLQGSDLMFEVRGNVIFIRKKTLQQTDVQQTRPVRGKITGTDKKPLIGVTVILKGSTIGVVTNNDGEYVILIPATGEEVLRFSFVGMKTKDVPVGKQAVVNVTMEEEVSQLEDVVVTGIFTRKAESYTGSAITIKADELKRVGNQNLFQSLKNLDPSLMIFDNLTQGSNPNALPSMQLRGASTFPGDATSIRSRFENDPNTPLFILDGFETEVEKVFDMDMNRIESVTILKDAAAKAIYGVKAASGVVVIETKKLRANETRVTYTGSVDITMPDLSSYDLCNALEKLEVERREDYYTGTYMKDVIAAQQLYNSRLKTALEGKSTYWLSKPLHTGVGHQHSVQVEMGEGALQAMASFSYQDEIGVMKGSDRRVINGDLNLSYRRKGVLFRDIMSISDMKGNNSPYGLFSEYARLNPYLDPYDENGELVESWPDEWDSKENHILGNPLYNAQLNTKLTDSYLHFINNFYVEINVLNSLKLVAKLGVESEKSEGEEFYPARHTKFLGLTGNEEDMKRRGSYDMSNGKMSKISGDFSFQYSKMFGVHDIFATAQWSVAEKKYSEVEHYTEGFPNDRMTNISFARRYALEKTPTGSDVISRDLGYLFVGGYSYDNRYMTDLTLKGSAASVFGVNNRWGTFWSVGLAWNVHNEHFLRGSNVVEQLKLRGSVGSTGNPNFTSNRSLAVYRYFNDKYYQDFTGATLNNMENPNLSWERKIDYTVGLDAQIAGILLKLDAYLSDTKDMAFNRTIVASTGFSTVTDNLGEVRNKGIELSTIVPVWRNKDGFLNVSFKIATNDNRIRKISESLRAYNEAMKQAAQDEGQTAPVPIYEDGRPVNSIFAVRSLGINPLDGKEIFLDQQGNKTNVWSRNNLVFCGSADPKYNGNFGFNGEYKGVGLSAVCRFYGGGYRYNNTLVDRVENCDISENVDRRVFSDRWYYAGQEAQFRNGWKDGRTQATSRFVQKENVLEISSLSAYYEFPTDLLRKILLKRLRLSVYMNDVATFSSIKIERGTDYPFASTLSFSLTATF